MTAERVYTVGIACLAAFAAVTGAEVAWALGTPGDFFANGSSLVVPSLALAGIVGLVVGARIRGRLGRGAVLLVAALAAAYWITVPDGWWAVGPPGVLLSPGA